MPHALCCISESVRWYSAQQTRGATAGTFASFQTSAFLPKAVEWHTFLTLLVFGLLLYYDEAQKVCIFCPGVGQRGDDSPHL